MKHDLGKLSERINQFHLDIRAEVIAADLLEKGMSADRLFIQNVGQHKRSFSRDIEEVSTEEYRGKKEYLILKLNRDGIYDGLPQSIFHQQKMSSSEINISAMTKEYKQRKQEEKEARIFFSPLENEFILQKTFIELIERNLFFELNDNILKCYGAEFLNVDEELPDSIISKITSLLPYFSKIAGNISLASKCLSLILGVGITTEELFEERIEDRSERLGIGSMQLGVTSTMGKSFLPDFPLIKFIIGPVKKHQVVHYLDTGLYNGFIKNFYDFFLPFNVEPVTEIILEKEEFNFKLSPLAEDARLGFTTVL